MKFLALLLGPPDLGGVQPLPRWPPWLFRPGVTTPDGILRLHAFLKFIFLHPNAQKWQILQSSRGWACFTQTILWPPVHSMYTCPYFPLVSLVLNFPYLSCAKAYSFRKGIHGRSWKSIFLQAKSRYFLSFLLLIKVSQSKNRLALIQCD